jgi:hypothetical protein
VRYILAEIKTNTLTLGKNFPIVLMIFNLAACTSGSNQVDISEIKIDTEVYRFDQELFNCPANEVYSCIGELQDDFYPFLQSGDSAFWYKQRNDSLLNRLNAETKSKSESFQQSLDECLDVLKHHEHYFPGKTPSRLYTYISPLDFDYPLFIADSLIFIAFDQYLGENSSYYQNQPAYLMRGRSTNYMAIDLAEALAGQRVFRQQEGPNDLISTMLYEGKLIYLSSQLCPSKEEHEYLRYTAEEWEFCKNNEANIWSYLIEQQAIFSSESDLKRRLIQPAPFSKFYLPIDNQSPGRVGRWMGYRIVKSRMDQGDMSIQELVRSTDSRKFLRESKYKP